MDIGKIVGMKEAGVSNREISRKLGYDRGTISKALSRYYGQVARLKGEGADIRAIQEEINKEPKYTVSGRFRRKYTEGAAAKLAEILEAEEAKTRRLGKRHKQKLTNVQIHSRIRDAGFDVSRCTINIELAKARKKLKEAYIRQLYDFCDRLEYDFGEIIINCGQGYKKYHMAVFASPASGFRWAYLYTNEKQGVFLDSHVRFFEEMGGVWKEVVYDNMKNVVHKFIGKNEKELNPALISMALYYGYDINVTNCFSGNEKGTVENSVKYLRNQIFAEVDAFPSFEAAEEYMVSRLNKLNEESRIEEEKKCLLPYKPPLELAEITPKKVDTYGFVSVDAAFYSVPEEYVGRSVIVKKYHDEVRVCDTDSANPVELCRHKRIFGKGSMSVNIYHYLNNLLKKPGAVRNSLALKSIPKLKAIFDTHYSKEPKKFIETFIENKHLPLNELIEMFVKKTNGEAESRAELQALDIVKPLSDTDVAARALMMNYAELINAEVKNLGDGGNTGVGEEAAADVHTGASGGDNSVGAA